MSDDHLGTLAHTVLQDRTSRQDMAVNSGAQAIAVDGVTYQNTGTVCTGRVCRFISRSLCLKEEY